jgi:acetoacetyl-CoA synthetase
VRIAVCSDTTWLTLFTRNPGGIRFGSAEIYDVIDTCFSEGTPGLSREMTVVDALCVGQKIGVEKADERVLLFVKLLDGVTLSKELTSAIAKEVTNRRSRRHVPAKVHGACARYVSLR